MTITTKKFCRKPFYVDGIQVTEENINDVAAWCGGEVLEQEPKKGDPKKYIKVDVRRPLHHRQTMAFVNDWILKAGTGFKVYTESAFDSNFDPVEETEELRTVNEKSEVFSNAGNE